MFAESGIANAAFNDGTLPIDEKSKMRAEMCAFLRVKNRGVNCAGC